MVIWTDNHLQGENHDTQQINWANSIVNLSLEFAYKVGLHLCWSSIKGYGQPLAMQNYKSQQMTWPVGLIFL